MPANRRLVLLAAAALGAGGIATAAPGVAAPSKRAACPATLGVTAAGDYRLVLRCAGAVSDVSASLNAYLDSVQPKAKTSKGALRCTLVRRHRKDRTSRLDCAGSGSGTVVVVFDTVSDPACGLKVAATVTQPKPKRHRVTTAAGYRGCRPVTGATPTTAAPTPTRPAAPSPTPTGTSSATPAPTASSDPSLNDDYLVRFSHHLDYHFDGDLHVSGSTIDDHETDDETWDLGGDSPLDGDPTQQVVKSDNKDSDDGKLDYDGDPSYVDKHVSDGYGIAMSKDPNTICHSVDTDELTDAGEPHTLVATAAEIVGPTSSAADAPLNVVLKVKHLQDDENAAQSYHFTDVTTNCGGSNSEDQSYDLWGNRWDGTYSDYGYDAADLSTGGKALTALGASWVAHDDVKTLANGTREETVATLTLNLPLPEKDSDTAPTGEWVDTFSIVKVETKADTDPVPA